MPRLAGRGVLIAALAVPIAMVLAPLTASADIPENWLADDHAATAEVATPVGVAIEEEIETIEIYEVQQADQVFAADEILQTEGVTVVDDPYVSNTTTTATAIEAVEAEETLEVNEAVEAEDTLVVEETVEAEDTLVVEETVEAEEVEDVQIKAPEPISVTTDDGFGGVSYDETFAYAGEEGAWVSSTESGAMWSDGTGFGHSDEVAFHHEVDAAAGSDGAFVESNSSTAMTADGSDLAAGHDGLDVAVAEYDQTAAHAGVDGSWVANIAASAGQAD